MVVVGIIDSGVMGDWCTGAIVRLMEAVTYSAKMLYSRVAPLYIMGEA